MWIGPGRSSARKAAKVSRVGSIWPVIGATGCGATEFEAGIVREGRHPGAGRAAAMMRRGPPPGKRCPVAEAGRSQGEAAVPQRANKPRIVAEDVSRQPRRAGALDILLPVVGEEGQRRLEAEAGAGV